jgi:hypothetical protein
MLDLENMKHFLDRIFYFILEGIKDQRGEDLLSSFSMVS